MGEQRGAAVLGGGDELQREVDDACLQIAWIERSIVPAGAPPRCRGPTWETRSDRALGMVARCAAA